MSDIEIMKAVASFKDGLTTYTMQDFRDMYNKPECQPIFSCGYEDYYTKYYK